MDKKLLQLMNEQIQKELFSAYLYYDMANYYNAEGLEGFANWFYIQAKEEMDHANLFKDYLIANNQVVKLLPIEAPDITYTAFDQPLEESLKHEQYVTASIYTIYEAAKAAGDYRAIGFLNWFIKEQGEEEKNATDLITKYKLFGTDAKGLYMLNQEFGARQYAAPDMVVD